MNDQIRNEKRTVRRRRRRGINLRPLIPLFVILLIAGLAFVHTSLNNKKSTPEDNAEAASDTQEGSDYLPAGYTTGADIDTDTEGEVEEDTGIPEEDIYSFLQGPKAWKKKKPWSGSWGEKYMKIGLNFSSFGCGHCCIANIYDTLSPYEISPIDAYKFARNNSIYYPSSASGAIGWEALSDCLDQMGVECTLKRKPEKYSTFQYRMDHSVAAVILLQSDDPDSFWGTISGHYVTIWNYNSSDDTVFVANPGAYKKNRKTIPLKDCYDFLKSVSPFQVLYIYGYDETFDTWKPTKGIKEKWIRPDHMNI